MRKVLLSCLLFWLPLSVGHAQPQPAWFFGVGGGLVTFDDSVDSVEPMNWVLRGGLALNEVIEVGVDASFTFSDDELSGAEFDVDFSFVFIRANLNLSESTRLYVMAGTSSIELTRKIGSNSVTFDDAGPGFGIGVEFGRSPESAYFIDYITYYDDNQFDGIPGNVTLDGLNIGFISYF